MCIVYVIRLEFTSNFIKFLLTSVISFLIGIIDLFILVWMSIWNIFSLVLQVQVLWTAQLELILPSVCLYSFAPTDPFELIIIITRHFRCVLRIICDLTISQLIRCNDVLLSCLKLSWTFKVKGTFFFRKWSYILRKWNLCKYPLYANVHLSLSIPPPKNKTNYSL